MEKKYKHKKTDFVAIKVVYPGEPHIPNVYRVDSKGYGCFIPADIVEHGNDWELIEEKKPKQFVTFDMVTVREPHCMFHVHFNGEISSVTVEEVLGMYAVTRPYEERTYASYDKAVEYAKILKKPKVILTTQDGIDITDRYQTIYILKPDWGLEHLSAQLITNDYYRDLCKLFSSEAKRDDYILENKPCMSLHEVEHIMRRINFVGKHRVGYNEVMADIIRLAKEKLSN